MNKIKKLLDKTFWIYVALGFLNYGICSLIMLAIRFGLNVSESSSIHVSFALQTMMSFLLNRYVTFRKLKISKWWPVRFFVSVGVSYLLAKVLLLQAFKYLITLPFFIGIADWIQGIAWKEVAAEKFREALVMLACTFIYCVINYIGQRYFVFRPRKENE